MHLLLHMQNYNLQGESTLKEKRRTEASVSHCFGHLCHGPSTLERRIVPCGPSLL